MKSAQIAGADPTFIEPYYGLRPNPDEVWAGRVRCLEGLPLGDGLGDGAFRSCYRREQGGFRRPAPTASPLAVLAHGLRPLGYEEGEWGPARCAASRPCW